MTSGGTDQKPGRSVVDICEIAELGDESKSLLRDDLKPPEFVGLLLENRQFPDAIRFLAHSLPKREAVWWAWVCARRSTGPNPPPQIKASLDATEKWIAQPSEENRRTAMAMAEQAEFGTAAGCAGLAAFFSGGSLAPPNVQAVPPGEFLTAKAVAGSVVFAAVSTEPEKAPDKFRAFIDQGLDVARRIKLWEKQS